MPRHKVNITIDLASKWFKIPKLKPLIFKAFLYRIYRQKSTAKSPGVATLTVTVRRGVALDTGVVTSQAHVVTHPTLAIRWVAVVTGNHAAFKMNRHSRGWNNVELNELRWFTKWYNKQCGKHYLRIWGGMWLRFSYYFGSVCSRDNGNFQVLWWRYGKMLQRQLWNDEMLSQSRWCR